MLINKRSNFVFFLIFLLLIGKINNEIKSNKSDKNEENSMRPDEPKHDDFFEKSIIAKAENNKLKIQIEVYNVYIYFLISLNILFAVIILSFIIFKKCFNSPNTYTLQEFKENILLNHIFNKNNESYLINKDDYDEDYNNDELLNNSGLEAPPIQLK